MASKVPVASREDVTRPPKGWRKPIPLAIKLQVIVNQHGKAPDGTLLDAIKVGIQFDHRPPLHEREYDPERTKQSRPPTRLAALSPSPCPFIAN